MAKIVITGAGGQIGSGIRPILRRIHQLRLVDIAPLDDLDAASEIAIKSSVGDLDAMVELFAGSDLVVHLAAYLHETSWPLTVEGTVMGTHTVLEAARRAGVARVLVASSVHIAGFVPVLEADAEVVPVRPDTFYGVGKAVAEGMASLYADRFGLSIVSLRIMSYLPQPNGLRALATWLSPGDMARAVEATLALNEPGNHIVWGVSRNTRRWVSLAAGEAIGFSPRDDAEDYAASIEGSDTDDRSLGETVLGGGMAFAPLGDEK
jgi:uronate dehydrogenase